ncbi:HDIG domain-containing protein [bacterium]|nr:HDIG domain-containing protein [bacterium]
MADLAEEAIKEIGGDWLEARVGALYHDIGKLKRPGFFAENIHDLHKNPHDGLPPETSVKIIKDHVADGLEMAREANLPRELLKYISEHHGTYQIKYFYHKAMLQHREDPGKHAEPVREEFSYAGPLPQCRESGVLMLADVTEAVVRTMGTDEEDEVHDILASIFIEKIEEKQLVESGLTLGEMEKVKGAFARILIARGHHRVRYPGEPPAPIHFHSTGDSSTRGSGILPA